MSDAALDVRGLTAYIEGPSGLRRVLDHADLRVRLGRTFALLGESGSGKTCLLHSLLGLHSGIPGVVRGRATLLDVELFAGLERYVSFRDGDPPRVLKDVVGWTRGLRRNLSGLLGERVTLVPQDPLTSLSPFHTVGRMLEQSVRRGDAKLGPSEARERALRWLESVHMYSVADVAQRYTHELSGGMAQRVAIALALAPRPKVVVADEPTTGLDATLRVRILELLHAAVEQGGVTLLLITHDMEAARLLARDVAVLCGGKVVEAGPAQTVLDPGVPFKHPYTAFLLEAERRLVDGGDVGEWGAERPGGEGGGCEYRTRCPRSGPKCAGGVPELAPALGDHRVACWEAAP